MGWSITGPYARAKLSAWTPSVSFKYKERTADFGADILAIGVQAKITPSQVAIGFDFIAGAYISIT